MQCKFWNFWPSCTTSFPNFYELPDKYELNDPRIKLISSFFENIHSKSSHAPNFLPKTQFTALSPNTQHFHTSTAHSYIQQKTVQLHKILNVSCRSDIILLLTFAIFTTDKKVIFLKKYNFMKKLILIFISTQKKIV